jgi:hypothetical protein
MGCIFLEMLTVICDMPLVGLQKFKARDGDDSYHAKLDWILDNWLPELPMPSELLPATAEPDFLALKDTIARMLSHEAKDRPKADELSFGTVFQRECCPHPYPTPAFSHQSNSCRPSSRRASAQVSEVREASPHRRSEKPLFGEVVLGHGYKIPTEKTWEEPLRQTSPRLASDFLKPLRSPTLYSSSFISMPSLSSTKDNTSDASGQSTPRTSRFLPMDLPIPADTKPLLGGSPELHASLEAVMQELPREIGFQLKNTEIDAEPWTAFSTDSPPKERRGSPPPCRM